MKKNNHRISAFALALLIVGTAMSFSLDMHFCQGHLKSISLLGTAKSCHQTKKACPIHGQMMSDEQKKDCCNNKNLTVDELDADYTFGVIDFPQGQPSNQLFQVTQTPHLALPCQNYMSHHVPRWDAHIVYTLGNTYALLQNFRL